jgi:hypothetical protein
MGRSEPVFLLPRNGGLARKARSPLPGFSFFPADKKKAGVFSGLFCSVKDRLALRELEAAAGFGLAVFLTFNGTAVTGEEAALLEGRTKVWLKIGKRP